MPSLREEFILAYDASCGPCSTFKGVVSFVDARSRLRFVSLMAADDYGLLDGVAQASRYGSFHLVRRGANHGRENEVWSGSLAILPLTRALFPRGAAVAQALERLPACMRALSFAYATVSGLHRACSSSLTSGSRMHSGR